MKKEKDYLTFYEDILNFKELTPTEQVLFAYLCSLSKKGTKEIKIFDFKKTSELLNIYERSVHRSLIGLVDKKYLFKFNDTYSIENIDLDKAKYFKIPLKLLQSSLLEKKEIIVLSYLYDYVRHNKKCKFKNDYLIEKLGISMSSIQRYFSKFDELGFTSREYTNSGFIKTGRDIIVHAKNIENIESIERAHIEKATIENIERADIETKNINRIDKVNDASVNKVEKADIETANINRIDRLDKATIEKVEDADINRVENSEINNTNNVELIDKADINNIDKVEKVAIEKVDTSDISVVTSLANVENVKSINKVENLENAQINNAQVESIEKVESINNSQMIFLNFIKYLKPIDKESILKIKEELDKDFKNLLDSI